MSSWMNFIFGLRSLNLNFTLYTSSKNQVRTLPKIKFFGVNFSKIKCKSIGVFLAELKIEREFQKLIACSNKYFGENVFRTTSDQKNTLCTGANNIWLNYPIIFFA